MSDGWEATLTVRMAAQLLRRQTQNQKVAGSISGRGPTEVNAWIKNRLGID